MNGRMKRKPGRNPFVEEIQRLTLHNTLDVVIARATVRKLADSQGYSLIDQVRISTAIAEVANYIVTYAGQGEIVISWRQDASGQHGLEFFCHDQGLNTPELTSILQAGGDDTGNKLNLLGLKKLVDEFEVTEDARHGNCVKLIKWMV